MSKKRILFVDDQVFVIEGLRRMLRKHREAWDCEFVTSGAEALAKMATIPFDVIVTDMQMPGMGGAELLERVVAGYPNIARIVLSGYADEGAAARASQLAHQYLSKPTDANALMDAVTQACAVQQQVGNEQIRALVGGCDALPSLPTLYVELTQAANSETSDAKQIAKIISRDMAMSAKLLQLVNSSFFGIGRRISSIEQTVSLLGLLRIKALVLTQHVFKQFNPETKTVLVSIEGLWRHAFGVAELARLISRKENQGGDRPDQAFTAGLLHDVGTLVLASRVYEGFETVLRKMQTDPRPAHVIEKEVLGVTHAEVGAYLLGLWGLPPRIVEAVALHHNPGAIAYPGLCAVTCVHVADSLLPETPVNVDGADAGHTLSDMDMAYIERIGLVSRLETWKQLVSQVHIEETAAAV